MIEAIEKISSIIALYAELETRLLIRVSALSAQLASSLVKLYTAVLQFLAKAHKYYAQRTPGKYLYGLSKVSLIDASFIQNGYSRASSPV